MKEHSILGGFASAEAAENIYKKALEKIRKQIAWKTQNNNVVEFVED